MADDRQITDLPVATTVDDADLLLVRQGVFDKQAEVGLIREGSLRPANNLSDVDSASQSRTNLNVPSLDDVLLKSQNLADILDPAVARANLEIPDQLNALLVENDLADLNSASAARTNLGLGNLANKNAGVGIGVDIATAFLDIASLSQDSAPSLNQNYVAIYNAGTLALRKARLDQIPTLSGALLIANNLSDLGNKATARSNLQLGNLATQNAGQGLANSGSNTNLNLYGLSDVTPANNDYVAIATSLGVNGKARVDQLGIGGDIVIYVVEGSGLSTVNFNNLLDASSGKWTLRGEKVVCSASLNIRLGTGAPPTYQTSNYSWVSHIANQVWVDPSYFGDAGYGSDSATALQMIPNQTAIAASGGACQDFEFHISRPGDTSVFTNISGELYFRAASVSTIARFGGCYKATTAVTSVQLFAHNGATFSGKFILSKVKE